MSLQTQIVAAVAGVRELIAVRLRHEAWPVDRLYVDDVEDLSADDEDGNPVTFLAMGADVDGEPTDDTGIDSRGISVPDPENVLWKLLEGLSLTGDTRTVEATVFRYTTDDLTAPASEPAVLTVTAPSRDGRVVTFEASNANTVNRDAPSRRYTYSNSPGLRR
jgi:hypothetical protein